MFFELQSVTPKKQNGENIIRFEYSEWIKTLILALNYGWQPEFSDPDGLDTTKYMHAGNNVVRLLQQYLIPGGQAISSTEAQNLSIALEEAISSSEKLRKKALRRVRKLRFRDYGDDPSYTEFPDYSLYFFVDVNNSTESGGEHEISLVQCDFLSGIPIYQLIALLDLCHSGGFVLSGPLTQDKLQR